MNNQYKILGLFLVSFLILGLAVYVSWLPADGNRLSRFGDRPLVNVYWGNSQFDTEVTCIRVFPIERQVSGSMNEVGLAQFARWAVEQLLQGPTETEQSRDNLTSLPQGVVIQQLEIQNGQARVDFSSKLEQGVGGSYRVAAIRAQITETLKQFPGVARVIISVDGRVEDALQS
ncbi:MAG: GerMN domain-containing protein [Candidatus Kerfeldbacteria bacterium]|nr:GerMN domain-containing protein [Candidatus Kerfeldbacteria bacterium]